MSEPRPTWMDFPEPPTRLEARLNDKVIELELENETLKQQLAEAHRAYALLSEQIITSHEQVQADLARMIEELKEGKR